MPHPCLLACKAGTLKYMVKSSGLVLITNFNLTASFQQVKKSEKTLRSVEAAMYKYLESMSSPHSFDRWHSQREVSSQVGG